MSALQDRLTAAYRAFAEVTPAPVAGGTVAPAATIRRAVDRAIDSAVRVRITPEIVGAYVLAEETSHVAGDVEAGLRAAFTAAGFQVDTDG